MGGMLLGWLFPVAIVGLVIWLVGRRAGKRIRDERHGTGAKAGGGNRDARIYRAALRHGGRITVSELMVELGIDPEEAEAELDRLCDGSRVRIQVEDDGTVFYEFPELLRRRVEDQ